MLVLARAVQLLAEWGLVSQEIGPGHAVVPLQLGQLHLRSEPEGLRLEVQLLAGVPRAKVTLWNVVHLNNQPQPFGQVYLSPSNDVCLGLRLPSEHNLTQGLPLVLHELIRAAESLSRTIHAEFGHLPWNEQDVRANLLHLIRTELQAPSWPAPPLAEAGPLVERLLTEAFGSQSVVGTSEREWGLPVGDFVAHVSLQPLPFIRQVRHQPDYALHLHVEAGILGTSDEKLWLALNRRNYEAAGLAVTVRYGSRKPVLRFQSELPAACLQEAPHWLAQSIAAQAQAASQLMQQLGASYRISGLIYNTLGI